MLLGVLRLPLFHITQVVHLDERRYAMNSSPYMGRTKREKNQRLASFLKNLTVSLMSNLASCHERPRRPARPGVCTGHSGTEDKTRRQTVNR